VRHPVLATGLGGQRRTDRLAAFRRARVRQRGATVFGSTALDVAIGLAFLYFILGAITSHTNELLAGLFSWRASHLEQGIRTLLMDPDLATKVWDHPVIRGIAGKSGRDPSYIPAQTFSLALFDALAPAPG